MRARCLFVVSLVVWSGIDRQAVAEPELDLSGLWRTAGYNLVLEVTGDDYAVYEITSHSAMQVRTGKTARIEAELGSIRTGASADKRELLAQYCVAPIVLERIDRLPDVPLIAPDEADPVKRFDILWQTFQENYAFFELRGVDWAAEREKWRPRVKPTTSEGELFRICAAMLAALGDNHVWLDADGFDYEPYRKPPEATQFRTWRTEYERQRPDVPLIEYLGKQYDNYRSTSRRLLADQLTGKLTLAANNRLAWGMLPGNVGYLEVRGMAGFTGKRDAPRAQFAALATALDRAISELADARAMIVDVRFNGGGWDDASLLIASRFADRRRAAFSKHAVAGDGFTPRHVVHVEPAGPRQFTRPVVLLTSPMTASAAEIFTFCMRELPHVTQAGAATMGIHSDTLERHLPGGWTVYLSNEVYRAADGAVYEKTGIPPQHTIEMFTPADFRDERDQVVAAALELLNGP